MERRLIPVNVVIGLCTPGDVYPAVLASAGYHVAGLEVPVAGGDGSIVVDVVLFRAAVNVVMPAEAKSGSIEEPQARKYGAVAADDLVRAASITISEPGPRWIQPLYVCLTENVGRVLQGLGEAGVAFPVLAVGEGEISHHGAAFRDPTLQQAFGVPVAVPGPPARYVAVDDESPNESFDLLVLPALVASLSHKRPQVSIPALAEQAIAHLAIYGKAARKRLVSKVDAAARRAAERDPATFEYNARTGTREHGTIRFKKFPEEVARQGRTQVYQAIARSAGKKPRRRRPLSDDQMALFDDLFEELGQAGNDEGDDTDDEEAGE